MSLSVLSKLNPTFYSSFPRSVFGQQSLSCYSTSSQLGHGRLVFGNSGLHCSLPYSTCLVTDTTQFYLSQPKSKQYMATSSSRAVFGEVCVGDFVTRRVSGIDSSRPQSLYFADRGRFSCKKGSLVLRNGEESKRLFVCGGFKHDGIQRSLISNIMPFGSSLKNMHSSAGSARDMSFDSKSQEQIADSPTSSNQALKLHSGSSYLPHPEKEDTGGEDAHFISIDNQAIGVADGVGGWADVGVNAGLYARELMSNSVSAIEEEAKGGPINPTRVLEKAHSRTKAKGSSTACIIVLTDEGLRAINLGDSGFMVIRDGCTIFHSPVQQHGFNFPYQLENGKLGDLPSSGQVFTIPVAIGDVIVAGTDGLFDNLFNNDILAIVVQAVRAGLGPEAAAQKVATLARQRALDKNRQTPFSTGAQEAGYRYYGGKLDDLTVVVSYITNL